MNPFQKNSKPYLFYELATPNEYGHSRKVFASEFEGKYERLKLGNGGDWCRTDGSLGMKFKIERFKEKGRIVAVQLFGENTKTKISKQIRSDIVSKISKQRCAVLDVSKVEVDHKDGHRDDYDNFKIENQREDQFQPLSKSANTAKREHCKKCRDTKIRFDAKKLGYKEGVWMGDLNYRDSCIGCFWHDIKKFNEMMSSAFNQG